jgi:bifunctional non-homologous end joining protein LigD
VKRAAPASDLVRYRWKRNFLRTPEPEGGPARAARVRTKSPSIFVIQKHAATRLHYDFRLELDGTLKSWAVPKGPSLDPEQKRLAVHVEDHPLDYANFEGIIPPKQYGAGTVLIWDRGAWYPDGDPREGYRKGVLKFRLEGEKLHGGWTLVRMHRRGHDEKDNWLLIKERDAEARRGKAGEIVESLADSVESGRDLSAIAKDQPRVWQANRSKITRQLSVISSGASDHSELRTQNSKLSSHSALSSISSLPGAVKAAFPEWIAPQLASLVERMPDDNRWFCELKYDGYRIVSRLRKGEARLFTRNQNDWTEKLRPQAEAVASLCPVDAWFDGEAVVMTKEGKTDFQALQNAFDLHSTARIVYCLFDVMYMDGYDLRRVPLIERKRVLASLFTMGGERPLLRYSDHIIGNGRATFDEACRRGLEGLMVKQADSVYRSGRGRGWLKIKCDQRQEFVVGGFTDPAGSRRGFGALLLGVYEQDELVYAGKVGTGFSDTSLRELHAKLAALEQKRPPFINPPTGYDARGAHWVKPVLVGEVRFAEWTKEGILRQPSFQGLRQDKSANTISRERPERPGTEEAQGEQGDDGKIEKARKSGKNGSPPSRAKLTHPDRVLFPDIGLTKQGLARYYEEVADWIVPHLRGRPLTLVRCPQGYQECFYQKHVNETVPKAIGRVKIDEDGKTATYMVADSLEAVLGLVQMGVLELHTWGAVRDRLDRPDRLTFDLDPDPTVPWNQVIEASQLVRTLLAELGLISFVKTTGGKGLHVVTPIQRTHNWDDVKIFSKSVAEHLVRAIPQWFTANMAKRTRKGKVFIDYLRNTRGATAIAAYSTRAKPGAPVSVPLAWDELSPKLKPDHFTVDSVLKRLRSLQDDPWAGYDRVKQRVTDRMADRLRAA